ncbi:hydrogen peroxide-inducible genes activator [Jiulongibacter sediminis]|jgi:LysR family hydrogen peroxide-inducible transcriptional activator|uniref:hydrogen peroxide-inducible genes activator n=1 Tax=Jiulongibacter sediminis TaxID=1605367 RepID=UPI0026F22703|nr:hydrogen peroxide-inducible genes activator [Jiulongibacter sediminis]
MNLHQLEYVLAVNQHRHFARAAEACHVTQPTLSMMIQKLEEELEIKIFDRSRQPVCPTDAGEKLILQCKAVLVEAERLKEMAKEEREYIGGQLRIGVIPTIAPYLLPLFIQSFHQKYPEVELKISEMITPRILEKLESGELDAGILVPPENEKGVKTIPLYTEAFVVYSPREFEKEYLLADDINADELLLLEEGHCFRSQIIQFCELRKQSGNAIEYTSGSLETLRNLADKHLGITILPELATLNFTPEQLKKTKQFASPQPVREVGLIMSRGYVKKKLIDLLAEEIRASLPTESIKNDSQLIPFTG